MIGFEYFDVYLPTERPMTSFFIIIKTYSVYVEIRIKAGT